MAGVVELEVIYEGWERPLKGDYGYIAPMPAVEQDDRPVVTYRPVGSMGIEVGARAMIIPVNHYSSAWVTNGDLAWTGTVLAFDSKTKAFETKRTRYVLDTGYDH